MGKGKSAKGKKKSSGKKVAIGVTICAAVLVAAAGGYIYTEMHNNTFLKGTSLNGTDISGQTVEQVRAEAERSYTETPICFTEADQISLTGTLQDYGYTLNTDELNQRLTEAMTQQKTPVQILKSLFGQSSELTGALTYDFDEVTFQNRVNTDALIVERVPSENAEMVFDEEQNKMVIEPEVQGNEMTDESLQDYVKEKLDLIASGGGTGDISAEAETVSSDSSSTESTGSEPAQLVLAEQEAQAADVEELTIDIPDSLYIKPEIYSDDSELIAKVDAYNAYEDSVIIYDFGSQTETYDLGELQNLMVYEDGAIHLDDEKVGEFVAALASKYDTRYLDRVFHTTLVGDITFTGSDNLYGYTIDQESEKAQLEADIETKTTVEREPIYYSTSDYGTKYYYQRDGVDDLAGTYCEVDLTAQHLWYYENGELMLECDIVSGDTTTGHGTSTGVFPLQGKSSPEILRGEDTYQVQVTEEVTVPSDPITTVNEDGTTTTVTPEPTTQTVTKWVTKTSTYATPVNYWMPFYAGQGLHDADWRSYFGGTIYQGSGSHGCVNMPPASAEELYGLIEEGTAIVVYYE